VKPRLLIADDHGLVVEGLGKLLESEFDIIGWAANGRELVDLTRTLIPDIVIVDISMPELNGIEAMRQIVAENQTVKFVVLTQQTDRQYVQAAFRAGAHAYVVKQSAAAELRTAIREVLEGRFYVAPSIPRATDAPIDPNRNPSEFFGGGLTPRQREVLQLVAEGKAAKEIAMILHISPKTVEFHKACLMDQLGLRSTAELTRYAISQGIASR